VVTTQDKAIRSGKVLVDWSQNHLIKTTVCAYSLRGNERPTVSTPVTWDEVAAAADAGERALLHFELDDVLRRIEQHGDLFAEVATRDQQLPSLA
jgi:bifunctional non-homologous end joining protein LigD